MARPLRLTWLLHVVFFLHNIHPPATSAMKSTQNSDDYVQVATTLLDDREPRQVLYGATDDVVILPRQEDTQYVTQKLRFTTVVHSATVHKTMTRTAYPTCTKVGPDVPTCSDLNLSPEQRSAISVPRNPRFIALPPEVDALSSSLDAPEDAPRQRRSTAFLKEAEARVDAEPKLIVVQITSLTTEIVNVTKTNSRTTVGITYSGCVPTDAPAATPCP